MYSLSWYCTANQGLWLRVLSRVRRGRQSEAESGDARVACPAGMPHERKANLKSPQRRHHLEQELRKLEASL